MNTIINSITYYDRVAYRWCMKHKHVQWIARIAKQVSRMGDGPLYCVVGVFLALLGGNAGFEFFLCALMAFMIEIPVYLLLKNTIKRDRPFKAMGVSAYIVPSDKFSFPSGHTAAAFVMASMTWAFFPEYFIPVTFIALAIGISRLLLGVHYFTDILAGACLGISTALTAYTLMQFI